jgi:hypothetical protein
MAYVSPSDKTTGDLISAAMWNQDIVANEKASAPDVFTAKGDLFVGTAADAGAVLPAGTNGKILTTDSSEATGLKWINFLLARQGGDATEWEIPGETNYAVTGMRMQFGAVNIPIPAIETYGQENIGFPVAFSAAPLVLLSLAFTAGTPGISVTVSQITSTAAEFTAYYEPTHDDFDVLVHWLAIGPG